jgi:hypothetical protein
MKLIKRIHLALPGRILQGLGFAFYLIGSAISIAIVSAAHKVAMVRSVDQFMAAALGVVFGGLLAYGVLRSGHSMFLYGKRLRAKDRTLKAIHLLSQDQRPPVLYLRSFVDDQITSDTPTAYDIRGVQIPRLSTEEEHLAKAIGNLGPFIALANPDEELPQLGATRISADEQSWRATVSELMSRAQLVIFRVGDGRSLWWEIERALETVRPERLLFLIPNHEPVLQSFRQKLRPLLSCDLPDLVDEQQLSTTIGAILYFSPDGLPRLSPLRGAKFRASNSQPLRPILRIALRPVFDQLNLKWTPPPIPLNLIAVLLVSGWVMALSLYWFIEMSPLKLMRGFKLELLHVSILALMLIVIVGPFLIAAYGFFGSLFALCFALAQFKSRARTTGGTKRYEKDGLAFSHHGNWKVTKDKITREKTRLVSIRNKEGAVFQIMIFPAGEAVDLDNFAANLRRNRPSRLTIWGVAAGEVSGGETSEVSRRVGGEVLSGVRHHFSASLLGESVPYTQDSFLLNTERANVVTMIQAPDKHWDSSDEGCRLIFDSLRFAQRGRPPDS